MSNISVLDKMKYKTINEVIEDSSIPEIEKENALVEYLIAGRIYEKLKRFVGIPETPKEGYQLKEINEYLLNQKRA